MTALPEQLERDEARQRLAVVGSSTTSVGRVRGLVAGRQDHRRIFRYAATSLIALAVSEVCLVALDAETAMGATLAALLANFAGTAPSYLLSRYWIWSEADRRRPARQVVLYWTTSLVSMGISRIMYGIRRGSSTKDELTGDFIMITMPS